MEPSGCGRERSQTSDFLCLSCFQASVGGNSLSDGREGCCPQAPVVGHCNLWPVSCTQTGRSVESYRQIENCVKNEEKAMPTATVPTEKAITREKLVALLNEDLAREYQAIIAYVNYSQVLKGAQYMNIADELAVHATEELAHALAVANHI